MANRDLQHVDELCGRIEQAMAALFGDDQARIDHARAVLAYADEILAVEKCDRLVVRAAAILHDIGIQEAERKHGSSSGQFQEIEGPPVARRILEELDVDAATTDHICRIVGSHHSANDIDTPEFRVIWDADWLVNIPSEFPDASPEKLAGLVARVFRTETGQQLAQRRFGDYL
ncbi:MAG: HD domain-containing protein [Nitrospiraceae bacterium]|nr:HD domain-containing protein [Nitrospiraceae bacterium]